MGCLVQAKSSATHTEGAFTAQIFASLPEDMCVWHGKLAHDHYNHQTHLAFVAFDFLGCLQVAGKEHQRAGTLLKDRCNSKCLATARTLSKGLIKRGMFMYTSSQKHHSHPHCRFSDSCA
eukprot:832219-Amphidinium_carterae.1